MLNYVKKMKNIGEKITQFRISVFKYTFCLHIDQLICHLLCGDCYVVSFSSFGVINFLPYIYTFKSFFDKNPADRYSVSITVPTYLLSLIFGTFC